MLVSACLLGVRCRYDGRGKASSAVLRLARRICVVPVCPEQLGGLSTPRPPAVIQGRDGRDVLSGDARVVSEPGEDVTEAFVRGAREALRLAAACGACLALFKDRSPSCGLMTPYCGRSGGGMGVAAALLCSEGMQVLEFRPGDELPPLLIDLTAGALSGYNEPEWGKDGS